MPTVHCTNQKTYRKLSYASRLPNAPWEDGSQLHPENKNRDGKRPNESLLNGNDNCGRNRSSTPIMSNMTSASRHNNGRITNVSYTDDRTLPAAAGVSNLIRKSQELIYVKVGRKEEYEAFELENPEHPGESNTVWVEWAISGQKQCVFRHQIVKDGLRARKRQKPAKFSLIE